MTKKTWYKCDPEKNKECSKRTCVHNKNAEIKRCDRTSHKEFSVDGIPVIDEKSSHDSHDCQKPTI